MKKYLVFTGIALCVALLFAAVGTSTLTLAPTFNLRLVQWLICPRGQTLEYQESAPYTFTDAEGTHRRANISIACVGADGLRTPGKTGPVIGALMGGYFLTCFVPLLGGGVWLWRLVAKRRGR